MTHIADLSPCNYFPITSDALTAVGWLSPDFRFQQGSVPQDFYEKIVALCADPWQPVIAAGFHYCELCQFDPPKFSDNLFVPFDNKIFVAPTAIAHYIATHWYQPPEIFINAVLQCPEMNTMQYKKAILLNGGRSLVQSSAPLRQ